MQQFPDCLNFLNISAGNALGTLSVCSSHPAVLQTAMAMAARENRPFLVEATASQVNQFGGYSGMTPAAFAAYVRQLAETAGLSKDRIVIGADHLGPHVWKHESAAVAMAKSIELARECVAAGFKKIHIDTDIPCADDPPGKLAPETAAQRAAILCLAAETTAAENAFPDDALPAYVIGNEVPPPGGSLEDTHLTSITDPDALLSSLRLFERIFAETGLSDAWRRVIAVVVQPGVDFGNQHIAPYQRKRAAALSNAFRHLPEGMRYEIHSTDFQPPEALRQMVEDHFSLLKAGPCLTFAFRKAILALEHIETELPDIQRRSHLRQVMTALMNQETRHWQSHYQGSPETIRFLQYFSYKDRIRYYWNRPEATDAAKRLYHNLHRPLPDALILQYLPDVYPEIKSGAMSSDPLSIIRHYIQNALRPYRDTCM
jgi:D-tagatose-1,6-bisphosphate aldolase subunit GatZ/KbaZ